MSNGSDASYTLAQYYRITRITSYSDLLEASEELSGDICTRYADTVAVRSNDRIGFDLHVTFLSIYRINYNFTHFLFHLLHYAFFVLLKNGEFLSGKPGSVHPLHG
jgi:hypothetical protein